MKTQKVVLTNPTAFLPMSVDGFELFARWKQMEAHMDEVSRQFEREGFRKIWISAVPGELEKDLHNWESAGYEVRRLDPEEEALARNLAQPWELKRRGVPQRIPIFVRRNAQIIPDQRRPNSATVLGSAESES